jgi:hypothetical protein
VRAEEHPHGEPRRAVAVDRGEQDEKQQLKDLLAGDDSASRSLKNARAANV